MAEYRLAVRAVLPGDRPPAWIVRNYRSHPENVAPDPDDFLDQVDFRFIDFYRGLFTEAVTIDRAELANSTAPASVIASRTFSVAGILPNYYLYPSQIAVLIRLTSLGNEIRHPGKVFVPFVPIPNSIEALFLYTNRVQTFATYLAGQLGVNRPNESRYDPVIWHRQAASSTLIAFGDADTHFWTQRDRAPRPPYTVHENVSVIPYTLP